MDTNTVYPGDRTHIGQQLHSTHMRKATNRDPHFYSDHHFDEDRRARKYQSHGADDTSSQRQGIPKFTRHKEDGNEFYRQWQKSTQVDRVGLLHRALECYKSAEIYASTDDELASINKNIGCTYFELSNTCNLYSGWTHNQERSPQYIQTAIDSFIKAITYGTAAGKSQQWQNQLREMLSSTKYVLSRSSSGTRAGERNLQTDGSYKSTTRSNLKHEPEHSTVTSRKYTTAGSSVIHNLHTNTHHMCRFTTNCPDIKRYIGQIKGNCNDLIKVGFKNPETFRDLKSAIGLLSMAEQHLRQISIDVRNKQDFADTYNGFVLSVIQIAHTNKTIRQTVDFIEQLIGIMKAGDPMKHACYVRIAQILYDQSVQDLDKRKVGLALGFLKEASIALEDATDVITPGKGETPKSIIERVKLQTCRAKAMQIIQAADHMREGVLHGRCDENTIYEIVDYYRKAINMTEEKQLDTTSMAYEGLANVFSGILNDHTRAQSYRHSAESYRVSRSSSGTRAGERNLQTDGSYTSTARSNLKHEPEHSTVTSRKYTTAGPSVIHNLHTNTHHMCRFTTNCPDIKRSIGQIKSNCNDLIKVGFKDPETFRDLKSAIGLLSMAEQHLRKISIDVRNKQDFADIYNGFVLSVIQIAHTNKTIRQTVDFIEQLIGIMKAGDPMKHACYIRIAQILYDQSVQDLDKRKVGLALGFLKEASIALEDATEVITPGKGETAKSMIERVKLQTCRAKAMQIIQAADHMREGVLHGRYDENTIYEIVDYYRKAINMTEEKQLDTTSMAYEGLANVFSGILNDHTRAQSYRHSAESYRVSHNKMQSPRPTNKQPKLQVQNPSQYATNFPSQQTYNTSKQMVRMPNGMISTSKGDTVYPGNGRSTGQVSKEPPLNRTRRRYAHRDRNYQYNRTDYTTGQHKMIHEIDQSNVSDADFLLMVTHHYPPLHGEVPTSGPIKERMQKILRLYNPVDSMDKTSIYREIYKIIRRRLSPK